MIARKKEEIEILREGGQRLAAILEDVIKQARPGATTASLDALAEKMIRDAGGAPSFKGYKSYHDAYAYPATLCVYINEEIVHGIPSSRKIIEGDLIGLDIGMKYKGLFTDMAKTVIAGKSDQAGRELIEITRNALEIGIVEAKAGGFTGDIGCAIEEYIESEGFTVVKELVGHGVGKSVHEEPEVPNWGDKGTGIKLFENMIIAIEPMVNEGSAAVYLDKDKWTWKTKDGKRSAHFEHTILITKKGAEILTKK